MAVASSARIHSLHGTFGGPTFASIVPSVSSAQASSFSSVPNIPYSRGAGLSILASRAAPSSGSHYVQRPRRSSVSNLEMSIQARRAAPPPPPTRTIVIPPAEDPFADHIETSPIIVALPPPRRLTRTTPPTQVSRPFVPSVVPSYRPAPERRAAKLVANVLLSRGCGRPMRRRPCYGEAKTYVKSGLSQVVSVEC